MTRLYTLISLFLILALSSCETDSYDTGDGQLSDITTVFGETCYDTDGYAFKFVTDDDKTLNFTSVYGKPNAKLAGKESRSLLYYHITDNKSVVIPYAIIGVLAADVIDADKIRQEGEDPIDVEAVWMSENKKYINISLRIKTSAPEDDKKKHKLGVVYKGVQNGVTDLHLIHDNGDIPGNYTVNVYFSVRVKSVTDRNPQCGIICLSALTEDGIKTFELEM